MAAAADGSHAVVFRPPDGRKRSESLKPAPLVVSRAGRDHVVGLLPRQAPGTVLLVPADLSPFLFEEWQRGEMAERLRRVA